MSKLAPYINWLSHCSIAARTFVPYAAITQYQVIFHNTNEKDIFAQPPFDKVEEKTNKVTICLFHT